MCELCYKLKIFILYFRGIILVCLHYLYDNCSSIWERLTASNSDNIGFHETRVDAASTIGHTHLELVRGVVEELGGTGEDD